MSKRRKNAGEGYGYMFHGSFAKKADAVAKERKTKGAWVKSVLTNQGYRHLVMSPRTNPRKKRNPRPFIGPDGRVWQSGVRSRGAWGQFTEAERRELKRLGFKKSGFKTDADVQAAKAALERMEATRRGSNPSELLVMGANPGAHEITAKPGETITIRVNPTETHYVTPMYPPRENLYLGFGASSPSRKELAASRRGFRARVRQKTKEERTYIRGLARSARAGGRTKRKLEQLFHEVYGANPAICGARIGGEICTCKPNHKGPHLPQGATLRTRERLPHHWKPRDNPSAAALRETFTGAESDGYTVHREAHMPAGDYAQLGKMLALYVKPHSGGQVQMIQPRDTLLVADESARQLWFVGGDQDITAALGVFGARQRGAGLFELGEARRIDYRQRKEHVAHPEHDSWRHEFGEESGVRPVVLFDATHKRLLLEGGEYVVRAEGIVN